MNRFFVWEIKGQVFIGISPFPALDLRKVEIAMGCRASRAFYLPESRALQQYLMIRRHKIPDKIRLCIHESFSVGKEFLLSESIKYAPHITPYK